MVATAVVPKRVFGYARVSSPGQSGERHVSLETQQAHIAEYAKRIGGTLVATFVDVASGRKDNRPEYRRMVEQALAGGADVIAVQFLDRFGRSPREILRRVWELQEKGITVEATDEDLKEELILLVRAGVAGAESRRISERVRATMEKAVRKGRRSGRPPFGFRAVRVIQGDRAVVERYEVDPKAASVIREMWRLSVEENLGFKIIADRLNTQGHVTSTGAKWTTVTVQRVIQNPALHGVLEYGRHRKSTFLKDAELVTVEGVFPPILSDEEWKRLQMRLAVRKAAPRGRSHVSEHLLGGMARCGHCGGTLIGKVKHTPKGPWRWYFCSQHAKGAALCPVPNSHAAKRLETAVLDYLGQFSDSAKVAALLKTKQPVDLTALEGQLRDVEAKLGALDKDFHANLDLLKRGILDEAEFQKANAVRREERTRLEGARADLDGRLQAQRLQAENLAAIPPKIRSFLEDFGSMEVHKQKARLQLIVRALHVYRDGRIEVEFR